MKTAIHLRTLLPAALLIMTSAFSQGVEGKPMVARPIQDITVAATTSDTVIPLTKVFKIDGVTGPVARFSTSQGDIDVELLSKEAPLTVENFLKYVSLNSYKGTFIHRSIQNFIIQGGGYSLVNQQVEEVVESAPVKNEFNVSNTRGTLAMAKLGGDPDSATTQWFFNESDENAGILDPQNGGFTVFGQIVGQNGLRVMDAIGALTTMNAGSPFDDLPVVNYVNGEITNANLVVVRWIKVLPLIARTPEGKALLELSVSKNTDPTVVKTSISGKDLILKYPGKSGKSTISVTAKYSGGGAATDTFTVTKN